MFGPQSRELRLSIAVGFFDESTDEDTQGISYAVAGFISHNDASACLELRWKDLLVKHNIKYFKASELSAGEGEFRQYRDHPDLKEWRKFSEREKKTFDEIKKDFTDEIIKASDRINGLGAVIILPDWERIMSEYPPARQVLSFPYSQAAQCVLMEAGIQVTRQNRGLRPHEELLLRPVFDSHEEYSGRMKQIFDEFCRKNPICSEYLLPPYYEDDQKYLSLQVADNMAFEVRKALMHLLGQRPSSSMADKLSIALRKTMQIGLAANSK